MAAFQNQPALPLEKQHRSLAHRQPLYAMDINFQQPLPQTDGFQIQPAPSQGFPGPLTRQYAVHPIAPPPVAPPLPQQIQPASTTQRPLQRRKTLIVTPQVPLRRCRFTARPLRREGALYGEADFRTPRPLMRTYAFYGEFPKDEHLPLLNARSLQRENAFYGESTARSPIARAHATHREERSQNPPTSWGAISKGRSAGPAKVHPEVRANQSITMSNH